MTCSLGKGSKLKYNFQHGEHFSIAFLSFTLFSLEMASREKAQRWERTGDTEDCGVMNLGGQ